MGDHLLTIIITFLNEGDEVGNTLDSIISTAVTNPNIILINDASDDEYPYSNILLKYNNVTYIKNETRLGVASCRNMGVNLCTSPYFLLLDAHMRFYDQGWDNKLIKVLNENHNSLICSQTKVLRKNNEGNVYADVPSKQHFGAYIDPKDLSARWNKYDICEQDDIIEIPCVLGAAYAMNKKYWEYLRGLDGLLSYGMDEQLLSIKVWLEGGRCLLIKKFIVGHVYRDVFPYHISNKELIYNRLLIAELFFPSVIKKKIFSLYQVYSNELYTESNIMLKKNKQYIQMYKKYLKSIFKNNISFFLKKNNKINTKNNSLSSS